MSDCDASAVPEYAAMSALLACLCQQIEIDNLPRVCSCSIQPGVVAFDFGDCDNGDGMAWVAPRIGYGTTQFPLAMATWNPCQGNGLKALQVEVGMVRNLPLETQPSTGELFPTTPEEWNAAAQQQMLDMDCIRRAISCCSDYPVLLGQWTPIGPQGGIVGGAWLASILVDAD